MFILIAVKRVGIIDLTESQVILINTAVFIQQKEQRRRLLNENVSWT